MLPKLRSFFSGSPEHLCKEWVQGKTDQPERVQIIMSGLSIILPEWFETEIAKYKYTG
jgi:hypothetical protein